MAQYGFGVGLLTIIPAGTNPTPQQIGVLQDVSIDLSMSTKELRGAYQFPVDIARAEAKIEGKAKFAQIRGGILNAVINGSTLATGAKQYVQNEVATIPTTPYQVTVANGATFSEDLGVLDTNTGLYMTRVAAGPTTGQYALNAATGQYTFAAADTGHVLWISYTYTTAATGYTASLTNQLMGSGTTFALQLFNSFRSANYGLKLWAVQVPKLSLALKNTDYTEQDVSFMAYADSLGRVMDTYTNER